MLLHSLLRGPDVRILKLICSLHDAMEENEHSFTVTEIKNSDLFFSILSSQLPNLSFYLRRIREWDGDSLRSQNLYDGKRAFALGSGRSESRNRSTGAIP